MSRISTSLAAAYPAAGAAALAREGLERIGVVEGALEMARQQMTRRRDTLRAYEVLAYFYQASEAINPRGPEWLLRRRALAHVAAAPLAAGHRVLSGCPGRSVPLRSRRAGDSLGPDCPDYRQEIQNGLSRVGQDQKRRAKKAGVDNRRHR